MTSVKPVSFQNQQQFSPGEFMIVRKPSSEEIKQMRKKRITGTIARDAVLAGMFTGFQAVMSKGKTSLKQAGKYFGQTFGLFLAISAAFGLIFNRRN